VLDVVSARVGLQSFFMKWDAMTRSQLYAEASRAPTLPKPLTRANVARLATLSDGRETNVTPGRGIYDHDITIFIDDLEGRVKTSVMSSYAKPLGGAVERSESSVVKRTDENDGAYLARLQKSLVESEEELSKVRARNAVLAEQLLGAPRTEKSSDTAGQSMENGVQNASNEALQAAVEAAKHASAREINALKSELEEMKKLAEERQESLTSLSTAYNGLEAEVLRLENEATVLRQKIHLVADSENGSAPDTAALDAIRDAAREDGRQLALLDHERRVAEAIETAIAEAAAEHEAELNDLLACLGQEEAHKEHLFDKLLGLGVDEATLSKELDAIVIDDET
jgi:hypothetical protein